MGPLKESHLAMVIHTALYHILGSQNFCYYPGMLNSTLHETELGSFHPGINKKIVNPFFSATDPLLISPPPALKGTKSVFRCHFPVYRGRIAGKIQFFKQSHNFLHNGFEQFAKQVKIGQHLLSIFIFNIY